MRVAMIAGTYQPDRCGVAHYTRHLRDKLAQQGVQSIVLTTRSATEGTDPSVKGAIDRWHLSNLLPLVQAIHRTDADLLHLQHAAGTYGFDRSIFLLPLLLRLSRWQKPIVTTIHEYGWWNWQPDYLPAQWLNALKQGGQRRGWWDEEDGFLLTQSDAIVTTNSDAEQVMLKRLPGLKERLYRIPIAPNIEEVQSDRAEAKSRILQQLDWSPNSPIAAFFGFLHPTKGLEVLLSAFQQVVTQIPQAKLLLIGGVESLALRGSEATRYWEKLESLIAALDLQQAVHMTGYLEARSVSDYLSGVDVGVLPFNYGVTLKSGSLLALMQHQLPVIATRANPPDPELNDSIACFIPARSPDHLAIALTQVLSDAALRYRLAMAGYRFSQSFSWAGIAEKHLQVYRSVTDSQIRTSA